MIQNPYSFRPIEDKPRVAPTKAVIYARCSPRPQKTETSLAKQIEDCRNLAKAKHLTVVSTYIDDKKSGKETSNRPDLRAAIADAEKHGAVLLVYDMARLSRSLSQTLQIIERLDEVGVGVLVVSGPPVDTTTPWGRMSLHMTALTNEFYRSLQGSSTKEALQYRREKGLVVGRAPYGWRKGPGGKAEPVEHQQRIIRWLIWRINNGFKPNWCARELRARGYFRTGGKQISDKWATYLVQKWQGAFGVVKTELDWYDAYVNTRIMQGNCWPGKDWRVRPHLLLHRAQVPDHTGHWPTQYSKWDVPALDSRGVLMLPVDEIARQYKALMGYEWGSVAKKREITRTMAIPATEAAVDPLLREGFVYHPSRPI